MPDDKNHRDFSMFNLLPIVLVLFAIGVLIGFFTANRYEVKLKSVSSELSNIKNETFQQILNVYSNYVTRLGNISQPQTTQYRLVFKQGYPDNYIETLQFDGTQNIKDIEAKKQTLRERLIDTDTAICVLKTNDLIVFDKLQKNVTPIVLPNGLQWTNSPFYQLKKLNNRYLFFEFPEYSQANYLFDVQEKKFIPLDPKKAGTETFGNESGIRFIDTLPNGDFLFSLSGGDACCSGGTVFSYNPQTQNYQSVLAYTYGCCGSGKDSFWGYIQKSLLVSQHTFDESTMDTYHDVRLIDPVTGIETTLLAQEAMPQNINSMFFDKPKQVLYMQENKPDNKTGKIYEFNPSSRLLTETNLSNFPSPQPEASDKPGDTLEEFINKEREYIEKIETVLQPTFPLSFTNVSKEKSNVIQIAANTGFEGNVMINAITAEEIKAMIQKIKPELLAVEKNQTAEFIFSSASVLSDSQIVFVLTKNIYQKDPSDLVDGKFLVESHHYLGFLDVKRKEVFLVNEEPVKHDAYITKLKTMYNNPKDVIIGVDKNSKTVLIQDFANFFTYRIIDLNNMKRKNSFYIRDFALADEANKYGTNIYKAVLDQLQLPYQMLPQNRAFSDYEMEVKPSSFTCNAAGCTFSVGVQKLNETDMQSVKIQINKDNSIQFVL